MRFANPDWLNWLLALLPAAALLLLLALRQRRLLARFSRSARVMERLLGEGSLIKQGLALLLVLAALALGLLALARPQWGTRMENVTRKGVDVLIAVDSSLSMNTSDVPPNRLAKAKEELLSLLQQLSEARVGVISFAGSAYLQCPLTIDRAAAGMFLEILDTGHIPDPGTNIGAAVQLARETFQKHQQKYKVLILITDGENLEGDPLSEATQAAEEGVVIFTIGIGTPSGQPIPVRDDRGEVTDYKKDESGNPVISKLDESSLAEIARVGRGRYFRATAFEPEAEAVARDIDGMEKQELQSQMVRRYLDRFQWPLLAAILCLGAEGLLSDRKRSFRLTWAHLAGSAGRLRDRLRRRRAAPPGPDPAGRPRRPEQEA